MQREPADGYWDQVWNKQPFCASYWGGRATQDGMYSTAYYSKADWNDTRFFREDFDKLLIEARGSLDDAKRADLYRQMALIVRDEGGLILPMFNDFIDAHGENVTSAWPARGGATCLYSPRGNAEHDILGARPAGHRPRLQRARRHSGRSASFLQGPDGRADERVSKEGRRRAA